MAKLRAEEAVRKVEELEKEAKWRNKMAAISGSGNVRTKHRRRRRHLVVSAIQLSEWFH
jgi:hypothetical protein